MVFFDKARRMAEDLYGLPISERLGYVRQIVRDARLGDNKLRQILTNQYLLRAKSDSRRLFHRNCPQSYYTIAQVADRYCQVFWKRDVRSVTFGLAAEPETGEVFGQ